MYKKKRKENATANIFIKCWLCACGMALKSTLYVFRTQHQKEADKLNIMV